MRLALVFCLTFLTAPALAKDADRTGSPYFLVRGDEQATMPLESTRAKIQVTGPIARVLVTQVYRNTGVAPIEAVYVFPGSTKAAVHGMRLKIGARTIEAKIQKKHEARQNYEAAKANGQTGSLLEQERPNVFTMNVANILPGDRIEVELDYTELLVPTEGTYELVYPAVVGPRYTAGNEAWTANPHAPGGEVSGYQFGVEATVEAGLPIAAVMSPSHSITPLFQNSRAASLSITDPTSGNKDFVLRYRLADRAIESGLMLLPGAPDGYFLLQVEPPARVLSDVVVPREYIFVVDVSGSMGGFPLQTAKSLVRSLFEKLRPEDRFNVLLFAGGSRLLSPRSLAATARNLDRAMQLIDNQGGGGGTELLPALKTALAVPRSSEVGSTAILLITDGYVTVEREAFDLVTKSLGKASLFTFGIGTAVNRHLIEGLARAGLGEPFVVLDPKEASTSADRFVRYVESPVLTDIKVTADGFDARDLTPVAIPDLYASRPIVVMGKYRGPAQGRLIVSGKTAVGSFEQVIRVSDSVPSDDYAALSTLWARREVERLGDLESVDPNDKALPVAITRLGLEHRILTAHTSFVAIDSEIRNKTGNASTVRQALPVPQNVSPNAVGSAGVLGSMGSLQGGQIGTSNGYGGLGIRGTGAGGGGAANGRVGGGRISHGQGLASPGTFGTVDLGAQTKSETRIVPGKVVVQGSLDREVIIRVIRQHMARYRHCYEKELLKKPNISGKVVVSFTIDAKGKVVAAKISQSTLQDDVVHTCLVDITKRMVFPKPAGGGEIVVNYPFIFAVAP